MDETPHVYTLLLNKPHKNFSSVAIHICMHEARQSLAIVAFKVDNLPASPIFL